MVVCSPRNFYFAHIHFFRNAIFSPLVYAWLSIRLFVCGLLVSFGGWIAPVILDYFGIHLPVLFRLFHYGYDDDDDAASAVCCSLVLPKVMCARALTYIFVGSISLDLFMVLHKCVQ